MPWAPAWREMHNGALAGMPEAEAQVRYPGLYAGTLEWDQPYPGGGESPHGFFDRVAGAFRDLTADVEAGRIGPRVAVVTHGGPVRIVTACVRGVPFSLKERIVSVPEAGVFRFVRAGGAWTEG